MLTGKQPNLSRMQKFGSECFAYKQDKRKLDSRCEKCVFIGYDKTSPAYIVYVPESKKVQKNRLVKFISKSGVKQQTQTGIAPDDDAYDGLKVKFKANTMPEREIELTPESTQPQVDVT